MKKIINYLLIAITFSFAGFYKGQNKHDKRNENKEIIAMIAYLQILGRLTDAAHKAVASSGK